MKDSPTFRLSLVFGAISLLALTGGCSNGQPPAASSPAPASPGPASSAAAPTSAGTSAPAAASAPASSAIQTQDSNQPGVAADLTECKRSEGVLTVKVRFRNTSNQPAVLHMIDGRNYDKFYVTAASKKYFILKDSEGAYLTPSADNTGSLFVKLAPGQSWQWWAKYPAPPADVARITLITPLAPPFEDVAIADK